jgi:hypothetical protein
MNHLTLSKVVMDFLDESQVTRQLKPLADQIVATNRLDEIGIVRFKFEVDLAIARIKMWSYEDYQPDHARLKVAQTYLHQLVDGCKGGYRGKLATEIRRVYRSESPEKKRRWGL